MGTEIWIIEHEMSPDAGAGVIGLYDDRSAAEAMVVKQVPEAKRDYETRYETRYVCGPGETIAVRGYILNTWI